jgi:hypothetical protein
MAALDHSYAKALSALHGHGGRGGDAGKPGVLSGIGTVAGRKMAYVRFDDGTTGEFTLSVFRARYGLSAAGLPPGARVMPRVVP